MKIGILTINDNNNYGNRLQNYAIQEFLKELKCTSETILNNGTLNIYEKRKYRYLLRIVKFILVAIKKYFYNLKNVRYKRFKEFNKNINYSKKYITLINSNYFEYDFIIVGSDQVWNPNFNRLSYIDLLSFCPKKKRISFSASFGISELPENCKDKTRKELEKFKAISVREDRGKKIVEELTGRKDVQVLVDPTMLLTAEEWDKVAKRPEQLNTSKYILNYFLGELSEKRKKEIEKIAKENNCDIINLLDKNSPFYQTGPSEFIYLEKNAFLICTDSFHSCVFAILFNRPFIVFDREESNVEKMNSRLETLLRKFDLNERWYSGNIDNKLLEVDYSKTYKILENERKKSKCFLKNAFDIKESD